MRSHYYRFCLPKDPKFPSGVSPLSFGKNARPPENGTLPLAVSACLDQFYREYSSYKISRSTCRKRHSLLAPLFQIHYELKPYLFFLMNTTFVSSTLADFRMQYYSNSTPRLLYVTVTSNEIIRNTMITSTPKNTHSPLPKQQKRVAKVSQTLTTLNSYQLFTLNSNLLVLLFPQFLNQPLHLV